MSSTIWHVTGLEPDVYLADLDYEHLRAVQLVFLDGIGRRIVELALLTTVPNAGYELRDHPVDVEAPPPRPGQA